mgnify:CR=1 FL=1
MGTFTRREARGLLAYPTGLMRYIHRIPLRLYRAGFGSLIGWAPFLVLTTRGRRSGKARHAVLEYRRHGSKYYLLSIWGERPHWYQNILNDPQVTVQFGGYTSAAEATVVDTPAEAMRALLMFKRKSPLFDAIMASISNTDNITMRTLADIAGEFTVIRLETKASKAPLPPVEPPSRWLAPTIILGIISLVVLAATRSRSNQS